MTRAERRRQERENQKDNAQITITKKQYDELIERYNRQLQRTKEITKEIITESLLAALLVHLKYETGFGKKRLQRVTDGINLQLNLVADKIITHDELIAVAEEIREKTKLIV